MRSKNKLKNCKECKKERLEKTDYKDFCSKLCYGRNYTRKNREKINKRNRENRKINQNTPKGIFGRIKKAIFAKNWRVKNRDHVLDYMRRRLSTGEKASPDNIIFYGYKEPLQRFEEGFGYKGVLMYHKDKGKVQCHLCGRLFKMLNNGHLGKIHGITAREYKIKTELKLSSALCGEETREKLLKRGWNPNHMKELEKVQERRRIIIKETGKDPQSHHKMSLETKNERGTCPDQLLDIIEKTIKSYGRVPTMEEFLSFHSGKYTGSIRKTFGGWTAALKKLGKRPPKRTGNVPYTREELCDYLSEFFRINERTPRWSDFNRGLLPDGRVYYKYFKNLNHARLLANVPLIIPNSRHNSEWVPSQKEREKMLISFS